MLIKAPRETTKTWTRQIQMQQEAKQDKSSSSLLANALRGTRTVFASLFSRVSPEKVLSDEFFESLEETLILADVGPLLAQMLVKEVRTLAVSREFSWRGDNRERLREILAEKLANMLISQTPTQVFFKEKFNVYIFVGVNGTGKTTTIAKFAHLLMRNGGRVISACADTFRAGAFDQLKIWADRVGFEVVEKESGGDPASIVYKAVKVALAKDKNALLIDTAGRMQTKKNLMDELSKISRSVSKAYATSVSARTVAGQEPSRSRFDGRGVDLWRKEPVELAPESQFVSPEGADERLAQFNFLVLDATTGQNAVEQAKVFSEAVSLTGIILTKIDGTAKGGVIFPVVSTVKIPVLFLGCGESVSDLLEFDAQDFIKNLLG